MNKSQLSVIFIEFQSSLNFLTVNYFCYIKTELIYTILSGVILLG